MNKPKCPLCGAALGTGEYEGRACLSCQRKIDLSSGIVVNKAEWDRLQAENADLVQHIADLEADVKRLVGDKKQAQAAVKEWQRLYHALEGAVDQAAELLDIGTDEPDSVSLPGMIAARAVTAEGFCRRVAEAHRRAGIHGNPRMKDVVLEIAAAFPAKESAKP